MALGGEDENQELMDALAALPPGEEAPAAFEIGAGDHQAPAELQGEPQGEFPGASSVPTGGEPGLSMGLGEAAGSAGETGTNADPGPAENENPDPAMAVEEMLSAAVLEGTDELGALGADFGHHDLGLGLDALLPEDGAAPVTFQFRLPSLDADQKTALRKVATELGIENAEAAWSAATPILSQLNEYQAVVFRREALALGIALKAQAQIPLPMPTEEEAALGELAGVPDPVPTNGTGAPSVELAAGESSVLLFSGDALANFPVRETRGLVTTHRSLARRFFREEELEEKTRRELQRIDRGDLPASRLELVMRELFLELQKAALQKGANAVLGLRLEAFPESSHLDPSREQLRLVAFGTAAVVEKSSL